MRFGDRKPQIPNDFHNCFEVAISLDRVHLDGLLLLKMIGSCQIAVVSTISTLVSIRSLNPGRVMFDYQTIQPERIPIAIKLDSIPTDL